MKMIIWDKAHSVKYWINGEWFLISENTTVSDLYYCVDVVLKFIYIKYSTIASTKTVTATYDYFEVVKVANNE